MLGLLIVNREEESLVLADGPADAASELLSCWRNLVAKDGQRCEFLVTQVVERAAVEIVGARLGDHIDHASRGPAELGCKSSPDHLKSPNRFLADHVRRAGPLPSALPAE